MDTIGAYTDGARPQIVKTKFYFHCYFKMIYFNFYNLINC